ncbi:MAG: pilus assembly protein TadG-related protein [Anaerovoracaceae bacterium]
MKGYKSFFRFIHDSYQKEEGAVVVIVALSMVVLLGFSALAIDMGFAYNKASDLQNALDSAALAAVQELPADNTTSQEWASAVSEGITYASLNNISISEDAILPVYKNDDVNNIIIGVKVNGKKDVPYHFAQVLGFDKMTISRSATAELKTVNGISNLVPLAIPSTTMDNIKSGTEELYLKGGPHDKEFFGNIGGWRGIWYSEDDSWDKQDFLNYYKYGYPNQIYIGYELIMKDGVVTGASDEAYHIRMDGHEDCTLENYKVNCPNCPRLITVPITEAISNKKIVVTGYASFFLEPATKESNGNIKSITATYIDTVIVPGSASAGASADYGVYVPKLTE